MEQLYSLDQIWSLPYPSILFYLKSNNWKSHNPIFDKLVVTILLHNEKLLVATDQKLVKIEQFKDLYQLLDQDLISKVKEKGQKITNITNRFDLIRIIVGYKDKIIKAGKLFTFGNNDFGQLGLGDSGEGTEKNYSYCSKYYVQYNCR